MNTLQEIENFINEFNLNNDEDFAIDTIRIDFSKQHKKENLEQLGSWKKINKNDKKIMDKLKRRLTADEVTSAYQLENYNIYYYNSNKDKPNLELLKKYFELKRYFDKTIKAYTDTYYINDTNILMIDKITIYNKAIKNNLEGILYRIEATISIPNIRVLSLPLNEFKQIIDLAKGNQ
jgi:hypothetical protein